jgi:hypothetical protein
MSHGSFIASNAVGRSSGLRFISRRINAIASGLIESHAGDGNVNSPSATKLYVSRSLPALKGGKPQRTTKQTTPTLHISHACVYDGAASHRGKKYTVTQRKQNK